MGRQDSEASCPYEQQYLVDLNRKRAEEKAKSDPKKSKHTNQRVAKAHTYIRMELCDGGDLETYLRNSEINRMVPIRRRNFVNAVPDDRIACSRAIRNEIKTLRCQAAEFFLKSIDASGGDDVGTADSVDMLRMFLGQNLQCNCTP